MTKEQIEKLIELSHGNKKVFKKNNYIIHQGSSVDFIYFLFSGACLRNAIGLDGKEFFYDIRKANNSAESLLGALTIYSPNQVHSTNFIALKTCICYVVSKKEFICFLEEYPDILYNFLYLAMDRYRKLDKKFRAKQKGQASQGIYNYLIDNLSQKDTGVYCINDFNISEIARFINVHRMTVTRVIDSLENKGIVKRVNNSLIIQNPDYLYQYSKGTWESCNNQPPY